MNGRFLKRGRMKKPVEMQSTDLRLDSLYYGPEDLYVGAILELNKHAFLLTSADEYVFAYMERPSEIEKVKSSFFTAVQKPLNSHNKFMYTGGASDERKRRFDMHSSAIGQPTYYIHL